MPLKVTHLSVQIHLGTYNIILKSAGIPELGNVEGNLEGATKKATKAISTAISNGLSFKMDHDQEFTVTIGEIFEWVNKKLTLNVDPPAALKAISKSETLNHVTVTIWDFEISTQRDFSINMKISFDNEFYESIKVPKEVTEIFRFDSLGIGLAYVADSSKDANGKKKEG